MLSRYHAKITMDSLQSFFCADSLREIIRANVGQDSLPSLLGIQSQRHVCDCVVEESFAYVDEEHATIAALATDADNLLSIRAQWAALGRLLHTVQDFFAHTNYVALWVAARGDDRQPINAADARLDAALLTDPNLRCAEWSTWREPLYYIPGIGDVMRRVCLPPTSHEAINLDSPRSGRHFRLAMTFAKHLTRSEYARAVANVAARGGQAAVSRFRGLSGLDGMAGVRHVAGRAML